MGLHSEMGVAEGIHAPHFAEPANFAAMLGLAVDADDAAKIARVVDTGELWALVDHGAQLWKRITEPTATRVVTLYIDTVGGDDAFSGFLQAAPVATMARAAANAPRDAIVVFRFLSAGNYAFADLPFKPTRWWWFAEPSTRVVAATGTCLSGTTDNHIVASGLTANAYRGLTIEMTSGPANTFRRTVSWNETGAIYPCRRFEDFATTTTYTPASGDSYSIYRPGVVITGLREMRDRHLCLRDIEFAAAPSTSERVTFVDCTVYGNGIVFRGAASSSVGPVFVNCETSFGAWDCRTLIASGTGVGTGEVASQTYAPSAWYADVGLASDSEMLARERGCGVSNLDITEATTAAVNLTIRGGGFYAFGTWGAVHASLCRIAVGGYFLGRLSMGRCISQMLGRWPNNPTGSVGPSITIEGRGVLAYGGTLGWNHGEIKCTSMTACGFRAFQSVVWLAAPSQTCLTFDSTSNAAPVMCLSQCYVVLQGTFTSTSALNTSSSTQDWAAYTFKNCTLLNSSAVINVTQSGSAAGVCYSGSCGIDQGSWNITAPVSALYRDGAFASHHAGVACVGSVEVEKGSVVTLESNLTVSGAAANQITVKGELVQRSGTLSAVATAGHGLVSDGGDVTLLGGADTTLTGAGAGKVGALTYGDGKIRYLAQPTGVSGTAGDLQCGTASPVADTALSVEGASVADASGANRQIRAAYAA